MYKGPSRNQLPPEILLLILSELRWNASEPCALPVRGDVPWFEHVRTLKSLQLVCREWCDLATPHLYSVVYLRHIDKLPALVRTLDERQSAKRGVSHWVECIYCELYIPFSWEKVYSENIARLISLCRRIRKLVHRPIFDDRSEPAFRFALLRIARIDEPHPFLRELCLREPFFRSDSLDPDTTFSRLTRLNKLHIELDSNAGPIASSLTEVTLPELETLICDFTTNFPLNGARIIAMFWKLPRLRDLSIIYTCPPQTVGMSLIPAETICTTHGAQLRSLLIDNRTTHRDFRTNLSNIFGLCRNLTHISYPYHLMPFLWLPTGDGSPERPFLVSETLRRVSFLPCFIVDFQGMSLREHVSELLNRSAFPSLDTIQLLDLHLRGESVDINSIRADYAEQLLECSRQLEGRGVRLLNCDSYPLKIEAVAEDVNTDDSDEDYEPDSSGSSIETSSDFDEFDFESEIHSWTHII